MKIVFGDIDILRRSGNMFTKVYNLLSIVEAGTRLHYLIPAFRINGVDFGDEVLFDNEYINYVYGNNDSFLEIMSIVVDVYEGEDVYILIDNDTNSKDILTESIIKILQQRYGIIANYIHDTSDLEGLVDTSLSLEGLYNFGQDRDRYLRILIERGIV
jgi:hypothetical protein